MNYKMNNVYWYTKNHTNCFRESTDAEVDELNERKRKLRFALRMQEREEREAYDREHANGYCPKCHCLLPLSGICNCE